MAKDVLEEPSESVVAAAREKRAARKTWFGRIGLFFQQVISELRKVVTPTRRELLSYTVVVLVFVIIMMAVVWGLDQLLSWLIVFVFGDPSFLPWNQ